MNSVQKVKENKAKEVYLCIEVSNNYPIVHFINKDYDGKYVDNSLGWEYEKGEYYLIRKIEENEFNNIGNILMDTKKYFLNLYSKSLLNKIYKINEKNLI